MWISKFKLPSNSTYDKYKECLIENGYAPKRVEILVKCLHPLLATPWVGLFFYLALQYGWSIYQMGVKRAFLIVIKKKKAILYKVMNMFIYQEIIFRV